MTFTAESARNQVATEEECYILYEKITCHNKRSQHRMKYSEFRDCLNQLKGSEYPSYAAQELELFYKLQSGSKRYSVNANTSTQAEPNVCTVDSDIEVLDHFQKRQILFEESSNPANSRGENLSVLSNFDASAISSLKSHEQHHSSNNMKATECDKIDNPQKSSLILRNSNTGVINREKSRKKRQSCKICGRKFFGIAASRHHTNIAHADMRPYQCQLCSKNYTNPSHLRRHQSITHPNESEYVSKNLPLVIRGGVKHWPAIGKWSINYFRDNLSSKLISVSVTPNGYADAIAADTSNDTDNCTEYFVMPEERLVTMSTFLDTLENPNEENVHYIQKQNSNFKEDFPELWSDAATDIPWANEAFGKKPDAVNIWMGDQRAVTSMHKDPYENIYCVVAGEKEFLLHPPTDLPWIPYRNYPPASYHEVNPGQWVIEPITSEKGNEESNAEAESNCLLNSSFVPWISVDPLNPDYTRFPQYKNAKMLRVTVGKGDVLYLPSLWFHHVKQTHACIALNYWYDMEYDIKYAYYKAMEVLC